MKYQVVFFADYYRIKNTANGKLLPEKYVNKTAVTNRCNNLNAIHINPNKSVEDLLKEAVELRKEKGELEIKYVELQNSIPAIVENARKEGIAFAHEYFKKERDGLKEENEYYINECDVLDKKLVIKNEKIEKLEQENERLKDFIKNNL